jgi:hypothetical protein
VPEPRDRPIEQSARGSLRPWLLSAESYLALLFKDPEEARQARRGFLECSMSDEDIRLYGAKQVLRIEAHHQQERSNLARAIAALTAHRTARERYLGNARAEGHPSLELPVLLVRRGDPAPRPRGRPQRPDQAPGVTGVRCARVAQRRSMT